MKRFRKALVFLLCLLLLAGLSACHGARRMPPFELPESFDTSRDYEITFWAKNDTNKHQVDVYDRAAADFHALYPNITVNLRYYTDYKVIYQDVITNIATQTTPNVCISYLDHIATYITGTDIVVSLNELMADSRYGLGGSEVRFTGPTAEQIVPEFLNEGYLNGKCYQLPFMRSTEACYINKTYAEKLGYTLPDVLTWDFIWEVSEAAAKKDADGNYLLTGGTVMIPFIYKSTDNMLISMLRQRDADYSTEAGKITVFNGETRAILKDVASHAKTGAFSTFKVTGYPANFLNAGQCVFAIDSTAGSTWMGSDAPLSDIGADRTVRFETAVRPIPQYDPANPRMISQGPSICIFNKEDPQEVLASWLFAQYLLTNEVQLAYSETEGYLPVTTLAQESAEFREYLSLAGTDNTTHYSVKLDAVRMLLENQRNTFIAPVFNGSASLREAAGEMIERVTKSERRKERVDDAYLDALFADIPLRFHLDQGAISR